jgi:hypothetical protein
MSPRLLALIAPLILAAPGTLEAQNRWQLEIRGGPAFTIEDLGTTSLGTGLGFEGTVAYRFQPHLSVYAGWGWNHFSAESTSPNPDSDFEETGYAFGFRFEHPISQSQSIALLLRAGGTYNHIEMENGAGDIVTDTGHGLGWEGGAGLALRLSNQWQVTPGVRFRSLTRDLAIEGPAASADLRYLAVDVGFARQF